MIHEMDKKYFKDNIQQGLGNLMQGAGLVSCEFFTSKATIKPTDFTI